MFKGSLVAMATPFDVDNRVDYAALKGLIDFHVNAGSDGLVIAATNGRRHMQELWRIRGEVFDIQATDHTLDVFGAEVGFAIMRRHFRNVTWMQFDDELRCTDPADVLTYVYSTPPGEDATPDQRGRLEMMIHAAFEDNEGVMVISKDVGCFVCRHPLVG